MGDGFAIALNGYGLRREDGHREVLAWHDVVQIARTAEEGGYRAIFVPEIGAREAFSTLVGLAAETSRVRLVSGVAPIGSRDPRRMAMEAATLQDLSNGRGVLGLGSREPIERTREEIAAIRALLAGEEPKVEGDGAAALPGLDLFPGRMPIYLAALGPRMTELAGEMADGVILNWCTPERVSQAHEQLARGAARAHRDVSTATVCVYVRAAVGMSEELALEALRAALAEYAGMPTYARQLEAMGLGAECRRAAEATSLGEVPESLVDALCVREGRDEALARLGEYHDAGADVVVVYPVPELDPATSITGTVLGLAPSPALDPTASR
ncbi:MAG TPA: LLM class flavin-dependent oxidoreductase [Actinomycetota bacterium]